MNMKVEMKVDAKIISITDETRINRTFNTVDEIVKSIVLHDVVEISESEYSASLLVRFSNSDEILIWSSDILSITAEVL